MERLNQDFFGDAAELPLDKLPTLGDVIRYYKYVANMLARKPISTKCEINKIIHQFMWNSARLYQMNSQSIYNKLTRAHNRYSKKVETLRKRDDKSAKVHEEMEMYRIEGNKLFEMAKCTVPNCTCEICQLMDGRDYDFLMDQRTNREQPIVIDVDRYNEWADKLNSRQKIQHEEIEEIREQEQELPVDDIVIDQFDTLFAQFESELSSQETKNDNSELDPTWREFDAILQTTTNQNRTKLTNFVEIFIRFRGQELTPHIAALLATALLQDYGIVSEISSKEIIDRSKVNREADRVRNETIEEEEKERKPVSCLGHDSKKVKDALVTIPIERLVNGIVVKSTSTIKISQDLYVLLDSLGAVYLKTLCMDYNSPELSQFKTKAEKVANSIVNLIGLDRLQETNAIQSDGTTFNTGWKGGINRFIELILLRALQWLICAMHLNELPLKNMVYQLDGDSTSKGGYLGEIGMLMADPKIHERPIVEYEPIPLLFELPEYRPKHSRFATETDDINDEDKIEVTNDQDVLFHFVLSVIKGGVSERLDNLRLNPPSQCRWIITGTRLLRLYKSATKEMFIDPNAFHLLRTLACYVVNVYAPVIIKIKKQSKFTFGAKHFHELCFRSQFLLDDTYNQAYAGKKAKGKLHDPQTPIEVVEATLRNNSYFAHCENILAAMLEDDDMNIRKKAIDWIEIIRHREASHKNNQSVRYFKPPKDELDFKAVHYSAMIPWEEDNFRLTLTEPPVTKEVPLDELINFVAPNYPCHSQSIEHDIQMMADIVRIVSNPKKREADMRIKHKSRKKIPKLQTKSDYKF